MKKVHVLFLLPAILIIAGPACFAQSTTGTLPVLIDVNAALAANNNISVSWTILQKTSADCFNVEKSNDRVSWHAIATVNADQTGVIPFTYNMIDKTPLTGLNFYRVRIRDLNGNSGVSVIKSVRVNALFNVSIYPNPSATFVNIVLGEMPAAEWQLIMYNKQGQRVMQKKYSKNTSSIRLPVTNYPTGNYTLEIIGEHLRQSNALLINHN